MSKKPNLPSGFGLRHGTLMCEDMAMPELADRFSTPLYVYSQSAITNAFNEWRAAFEGARHLVCYAVKANSNIAVLKLLASLGSGFDIVSGGELRRVLAAAGNRCMLRWTGLATTFSSATLRLRPRVTLARSIMLVLQD